MTAFSRAEKSTDTATVRIEIKSYNSRYLDTKIHITHGYHELEEKIKAKIAEQITRGRIELHVNIKDESEDSKAFDIDLEKAKAYFNSLSKLKTILSLKEDISLDHVLNAGSLITPASGEDNLDMVWGVAGECLNEAISQLNIMRSREGDYLSKDFSQRMNNIETLLGQIEDGASGLLEQYRDKLADRIKALTNGMVEIDPQRIAQESAFLADRSDISEEIVRTRSHLKQFRRIMDSDEPGGRKLNFLLQEFNREFNTMGSKIGNADLSHLVVDAKSELEKVREQVQNIE